MTQKLMNINIHINKYEIFILMNWDELMTQKYLGDELDWTDK